MHIEPLIKQVTTIAAAASDVDHHIERLREEIQQLSADIAVGSPMLKVGLERWMTQALEKAVDKWSNKETRVGLIDSEYRQHGKKESENDFSSDTSTLKRREAMLPNTQPRKRRKLSHVTISVETAKGVIGDIVVKTKLDSYRDLESGSLEEGMSQEIETTISLHPAQWLIRCGLRRGVKAMAQRSAAGWEYKLSTFRAVPDCSPIF